MVLGKLNSLYTEKSNWTLSHHIQKEIQNRIRDLNVGPETIKLAKRKHRQYIL